MSLRRTGGSLGWRRGGGVSTPAVWGKLPTHADYLQHGVKVGETEAWQDWLAKQLHPTKPVKRTRTQPSHSDVDWRTLDVPPHRPAPHRVPLAFVLPPGTLAFARHQYVLGVMAPSHDRLGREHPILVYHCANLHWLQRYFSNHDAQDPLGACQSWLFALARLLSRYVQSACEEDVVLQQGFIRERSSLSLPAAVHGLWALYAPAWPQWLGMAPRRPSREAVQAVLDQTPALYAADVAEELHGMVQPPWADWPQRLWTHQPRSAFWQQDSRGGYVDASLRLGELWFR